MQTKPEEIANVYHDKLEEKVNNIVREMEKYEESQEDEQHAVTRLLGRVRQSATTFQFHTITRKEMSLIFKKLPRKTSTGDDEVAYCDLVDAKYYTLGMVLKIVNLIIETSHWPHGWRNSLISPLFKGGPDKWDSRGYRTVALTSAVSRIVERVLNKQLEKYLEEKDILLQECHGFVRASPPLPQLQC